MQFMARSSAILARASSDRRARGRAPSVSHESGRLGSRSFVAKPVEQQSPHPRNKRANGNIRQEGGLYGSQSNSDQLRSRLMGAPSSTGRSPISTTPCLFPERPSRAISDHDFRRGRSPRWQERRPLGRAGQRPDGNLLDATNPHGPSRPDRPAAEDRDLSNPHRPRQHGDPMVGDFHLMRSGCERRARGSETEAVWTESLSSASEAEQSGETAAYRCCVPAMRR